MTTTDPTIPQVAGWKLVFWLFAVVVVSGLTQASGQPLGATLGTAFVPAGFALLAVLARKGDADPTARPAGLLMLWATLTALAFGSLALVILHVAEPGSLNEPTHEIAFTPGGEERLSFMMGLLALSAAASMLGLFRAVRAAVHDIIPVDPALFSHALGFGAAIAIALIPLMPLFVLGKPPLPLPLDALPPDTPAAAIPTIPERAVELAWFGVFTIVAAGVGSRRSWTACAERLGLHRVPVWHLGAAALAGVVLAWLRPVIVGLIASWMGVSASATTPDAWMPSSLPFGALIGLSLLAGGGTELTYRGYLQPRFGIVLANLVLAAPLAWTNNWDVLFVVFAVGLVFGALRAFSGTLAALTGHVLFLIATGLLAR